MDRKLFLDPKLIVVVCLTVALTSILMTHLVLPNL